LRPYRAKHGYDSRNKNKSALLSEQTWNVRIQRDIPPFQQDVEEKVYDVPIPEVAFQLRLPPFLSLRQKEFTFGSPQNILQPLDLTLGSRDRELHNRIVKKYRVNHETLRIRYEAPAIKVGQFESLIIKICCGFLFSADPSCYRSSGLGLALVREKRFELAVAQEVYSAPRSMFSLYDSDVACTFSVCHDEKRYIYCAVKILPEVLDNIYFVRIPATIGAKIDTMRFSG
jgi:hypothetical protein